MWNQLNLFCGWIDIPLSAEGIREAQRAGAHLARYEIDLIFASELERSTETAVIALADHPSGRVPYILHQGGDDLARWSQPPQQSLPQLIPLIQARALNERMYGELQGMNKDEARAQFGAEQVHQWRRSFDEAPPGGESLKQTAERTLPFFDQQILPRLQEGKTILICAHGNSLRSIIMEIERLSTDEILQFELSTGVPRVYRLEKERLVLEAVS